MCLLILIAGFIPITTGINREKYDGGGTGGNLGYGSNRWSNTPHLNSSPAPVSASRVPSNSQVAQHNYSWTELEISGKYLWPYFAGVFY